MMHFSTGTGIERVGVVGPGLMLGWSAGSWIFWDEVGMLLGWPAGYWIVGAKVGLLQCWSVGFGRVTLL